jgi:hypothetical protein
MCGFVKWAFWETWCEEINKMPIKKEDFDMLQGAMTFGPHF